MMKTFLGIVGLIVVGAGIALAADPDTESREAWRVQVDTNAATVVTEYTASKAGSLLGGKSGGSNLVWVAVAPGTNSWVKIAMGL